MFNVKVSRFFGKVCPGVQENVVKISLLICENPVEMNRFYILENFNISKKENTQNIDGNDDHES
jgi:hypothetical protein